MRIAAKYHMHLGCKIRLIIFIIKDLLLAQVHTHKNTGMKIGVKALGALLASGAYPEGVQVLSRLSSSILEEFIGGI